MEENKLKIAQMDIEDALNAIETMEEQLDSTDASKDVIKEKFIVLSEKLREIETILRDEGILE